MNGPALGLRNLVHKRCGEEGIELEARGAAIAGAAVSPALFTDFFEIGVKDWRGAGGAHDAAAASDVPNAN